MSELIQELNEMLIRDEPLLAKKVGILKEEQVDEDAFDPRKLLDEEIEPGGIEAQIAETVASFLELHDKHMQKKLKENKEDISLHLEKYKQQTTQEFEAKIKTNESYIHMVHETLVEELDNF